MVSIRNSQRDGERAPQRRRGAVAVEFAVIAPVLLTVIVSLIELVRVYEVQNTMEMACREGARFASLDRTDMLMEGQTANSKLIGDVQNFLKSSGISPSQAQVSVVKAGTSQAFDLDDPANDLQLFQVKISVPYSAVSYTPIRSGSHDYNLSAALTFRNGRATLSQ